MSDRHRHTVPDSWQAEPVTQIPTWMHDHRSLLDEKLGVELLSLSATSASARMPVAGNTQPFGHLHGGASCVLTETLGSMAAACEVGPGGQVFGVDINVTHHRSATDGWVSAEATALFIGGRTATYEVVLTNDAGERLATGRITCALRRPK